MRLIANTDGIKKLFSDDAVTGDALVISDDSNLKISRTAEDVAMEVTGDIRVVAGVDIFFFFERPHERSVDICRGTDRKSAD